MDFKERKQLAREIAKELNERNHKLISQLIQIAGKDFTENILEQTRKIQADGGMMTVDNKRKRTPGGVFFKLAKEQLSDEMRVKVFPPKNWKALKAREKAEREAKAAQEVDNPQSVEEASTSPVIEEQEQQPQETMPEKDQKLAQLEEAAQTLRERIAEMEAKGQKGVKMTKTLLANTERQIEKLQ